MQCAIKTWEKLDNNSLLSTYRAELLRRVGLPDPGVVVRGATEHEAAVSREQHAAHAVHALRVVHLARPTLHEEQNLFVCAI